MLMERQKRLICRPKLNEPLPSSMDIGTGEENIRPLVTETEVQKIIRNAYGLEGGHFEWLQGYDDLNYFCLPTHSCNPFIQTPWLYGYVLKITNSLDSEKTDLVEAQNAIMFHLRKHEITSPIPVQTMRGDYYIKQKFLKGKKEHVVRLLEFQPGNALRREPISYSLLYKLGVFLADLDQVLKEFSHPFYENYSSAWHLNSVPALKSVIRVVQNQERKRLVDDVIEKFTRDILEVADTFEKGMIHGDFNEHNILLDRNPQTGKLEVSAILDFGDSHHSCYLFELAIALCYMMLECKARSIDPVTGAGHLLAGYLAVRSTFSADFGLLKLCICARLCQSLVLGLKAHALNPENNYVMDSQENGWPLLEELWQISDEKITQYWNSVVELYKTETP